ncbi:metallophosphoesterase [Bacillus cereus]|uniref:Phosphoesterase n=1 Tax=Bacillus arachidis TaxID=2819290 RepID=A0ABS3NWW7_9BACI|nr:MULTISPECIES: metallophosphoesterase [Bacillus]MBO1625437.1 metallophosphoesterase [Bacillus arachidis]PFE03755.1 metallophosphoesterase [Bacillus sp. AFS023182]PGX97864.1 metallophosphoesterase [Bacillus cereus]WIY60482.1 metallophosphoesterase [Bacillus arachidis]
MRALIVSDSHGSTKELQQLKETYEGNVDVMIHCGDSELTPDHQDLQGFQVVKGNCDFYNGFEEEIIIDVDGMRFLVTHGHRYNVKMTVQTLLYRAKEVEADIVCFGHSHMLGAEFIDDILFINPGSIVLPRSRKEKTFTLLEVNENNIEIRFETLNGKVVAHKTFQRG